MLKNKPKLSIIIVSHNTKELFPPLLKSINEAVRFWDQETEIIIIDNASCDGSPEFIREQFPNIILISNKNNLGYAKANNQGFNAAKGDYLLLLNSDTLLTQNVISKMISYLEKHPEVDAETCKLVLQNGKIDPACHRGFPTPWASLTYYLGLERLFPRLKFFSNYHLWYKPLDKIHEIDSPSGAFYLVRKEAINRIGPFDEKFFMYGEDLDLSFRIKKAGWKIIYNPTSEATHLKKQSGLKSKNQVTKKRTITAFYDAMKIFFDKHYQTKYSSLTRTVIFFFIDIKKMLSIIKADIIWTYQSLLSIIIL